MAVKVFYEIGIDELTVDVLRYRELYARKDGWFPPKGEELEELEALEKKFHWTVMPPYKPKPKRLSLGELRAS